MNNIVVFQFGARHRYAIPRFLHSRRLLKHLYTDFNLGSRATGILQILKLLFPNLRLLKFIFNRSIPNIPHQKITSFNTWPIKKLIFSKLSRRNDLHYISFRDKQFNKYNKKIKIKSGDLLYVMDTENIQLQQQAKKNGAKIILEAYINPLHLKQVNEAFLKEQQTELCESEHLVYVEDRYKDAFLASDIILCPSQWVADGVRELSPEHDHKIRICPYGSSLPPSECVRAPVPGRIFWAGGDWFRKGLHHLAAAADLALRESPGMEFRIAGITDPKVQAMPQFRNLSFLGKLDRAGMQEEFSKADLFVFPTLTEGMASVMVEAVSAGCPVLATRGAGFDGLEESGAGRIFEAEDHAALAKLMLDLTRDRATIQAMNEACTRFALNFTEDAWAKRLVPILEELTV